jgi:hypothetical protein
MGLFIDYKDKISGELLRLFIALVREGYLCPLLPSRFDIYC